MANTPSPFGELVVEILETIPEPCEHCGDPAHGPDEPKRTYFCAGLARRAAEAGYGQGRYQGD